MNVGQGPVMTVQRLGHPITFALMGSLSLGSLALWLAFAPMLKAACA